MIKTDPGERILEELSRLIRQLTRISGGPDEARAMTATQRLALFELVDSGPLRLNDLAQRMGTSAPTASRAVDALDELGLVERHPDPTDRRAITIELTADGRRSVEERKARVYAAFRPAAAALSPADREQLAELLARLAAKLSDSEIARRS
ncbi:MAG TPA: MarR family transcriptional regulator [Gaiellaceae bacterium]